MKENINILIADDHSLVRQGLKNLLNQQSNLIVSGEAIDGLDAVDKTLKNKPDILLLDINMPKMSGFEALEAIKEKNPEQKVIILSIHNSREYIQKSMSKGADGYISKDADIEILNDAIVRVFQGESYIEPTIVKKLMDVGKEDGPVPALSDELSSLLTSREFEIVQEVAKGKTNKEIAKTLNISDKTVKNHMYNIFKKLDITDRTQAVVLLMKDSLI